MIEEKKLNALLPDTRNVLLELIKSCNFLRNYTLVGGSALTLYLNHRKSEDLDFFTYNKKLFSKEDIFVYFTKCDNIRILNETEEQIDILFRRVKITFFNAAWTFLTPDSIEHFNLAPLDIIAGMKVNTLFTRAKYRDYYDIFFLTKKLGLKNIFDSSRKIVQGITYKLFLSALLFIDDIEDENIIHLQPVENLSLLQIREFFESEIKKEITSAAKP